MLLTGCRTLIPERTPESKKFVTAEVSRSNSKNEAKFEQRKYIGRQIVDVVDLPARWPIQTLQVSLLPQYPRSYKYF